MRKPPAIQPEAIKLEIGNSKPEHAGTEEEKQEIPVETKSMVFLTV